MPSYGRVFNSFQELYNAMPGGGQWQQIAQADLKQFLSPDDEFLVVLDAINQKNTEVDKKIADSLKKMGEAYSQYQDTIKQQVYAKAKAVSDAMRAEIEKMNQPTGADTRANRQAKMRADFNVMVEAMEKQLGRKLSRTERQMISTQAKQANQSTAAQWKQATKDRKAQARQEKYAKQSPMYEQQYQDQGQTGYPDQASYQQW